MFNSLINWSQENYSHLPWRRQRNLYYTLVSEIMLQQTTVGTVVNHFERFVEKYPDIETLASIDEEQMLMDWKGLGYYRRARNLLNAAKEIQANHQGKIPLCYNTLLQIKGIGEYTANALLSIGNDNPALPIDANLERVLARFYGIKIEKGPKLNKEIQRLFKTGKICEQIHSLSPRLFNESLMDLGRSICKANKAACEICPLKKDCVARKQGKPLEYPVQNKQKTTNQFYELHLLRVIVQKEDNILVYKKSESEWLTGQYELPTFNLYCEDTDLRQYPVVDFDTSLFLLPSIKTSITKYKITNYLLHANNNDLAGLLSKGFVWKKLADLNLSTASSKALEYFN